MMIGYSGEARLTNAGWKMYALSMFLEGGMVMWFWWFMLACDLLVPVTMIVCGNMMWKHAPKSINGIIGYRTRRSMENTETWKFANAYCGRLWWKIGWGMLIPSIIIHIPFYHGSENVIGSVGGVLCMVQCAILFVPIVLTEKALKGNF